MAPNRSTLSRQLDRDVQAAIFKYLEKTDSSPAAATVDEVFNYIKRSNSNLARRSKVLLEDCIERILDVMKAEESTDSEARIDHNSSQHQQQAEVDSSKALNRSLTASWNISRAETADSPNKRTISQSESSHVHRDQSQQEAVAVSTKRLPKRIKTSTPSQVKMQTEPRMTLDKIHGMNKQIHRLQRLVLLPFARPDLYRGATVTRGVLLHGPPGCGKTMLCEAVAHALQVPLISISAPSVVSGMSGESEATLRDLFAKAVQVAPAIIFIDEIDSITPKRESTQRGMEQRIVSQLLTCMDDLAPEKIENKTIMVLAATNRPDSLDSALRRAGRFDAEIEISVPDAPGRFAILRGMTKNLDLAGDVDIKRLSQMTPGFVAADLESLVREAEENKRERVLQECESLLDSQQQSQLQSRSGQNGAASDDVEMHDSEEQPDEQSQPGENLGRRFMTMYKLLKGDSELSEAVKDSKEQTTMADFLYAVSQVQASTTREGFTTVPNVPWSAVGAYHEVREALQQAVISRIMKPEIRRKVGQTPPGVLLYGPPGCGKTLLAKAVASASHANFISVKGPELLNKYVGESEKAVRQLFQRARYSQPVIVFFDELDAMVPRRDDMRNDASNRVVNAMLAELDGVSHKEEVYVIGATNRRDAIDPAIMRPGRLGESIYVGLPGPNEREEILATIIRPKPVRESDRQQILAIAHRCDKFSGADLTRLTDRASDKAVMRHEAEAAPGHELDIEITLADFEAALPGVEPSVEDMEFMGGGGR